jgi:hypothetical protein
MRDRGCKMAAAGHPDLLAVVKDGGDSETAHLQGIGSNLGGCDVLQRWSDGSGSMFHHFRVAAHGPEWGRV